jgi:hypothetical protein
MKQTPLQRILKILDYYAKLGTNKEKINELYFKILKNGKY